jgi:hypothetical protein
MMMKHWTLAGVAALLVWPAWDAEQVSSNPLVNADFRCPTQNNDAPAGWSLYAGGGRQQQLQVVALDGGGSQAVLLADGDAAGEIGLRQAVPAQEGLTYEACVEVRGVAEASSQGANIQLRFLPSNRLFQESLETSETEPFVRVAVRGTAPPGTTKAVVYLYSHREPTPKLLLRQPRLISGDRQTLRPVLHAAGSEGSVGRSADTVGHESG